MSDVVISVEKLTKIYRLGAKEETPDTLVGNLFSLLRAPAKNLKRLRSLTHFNPDEKSDDILWALQDISFEVKRGEVVGIIGRNGAGKSTLLKILSRITDPTSGRVVLNGRVGSLLEVGTGFHPELSGRDNIYMNGTILGMTKKDIKRKFDEIVDFSGVEKFLDTPVKRYSSGMLVRLAFSVAAHLDPEILIVDEVLAVGDSEFQAKCLGKMQSVSKTEGKTVLFVSHNMDAVRKLCSKGFLLSNGSIAFTGDAQSTIEAYIDGLNSKSVNPFVDNPNRVGNGDVRFKFARILNDKGVETNKIISGQDIRIELDYVNSRAVRNAEFSMTIFNLQGIPITNLTTRILSKSQIALNSAGVVSCDIPRLPFPPGRYFGAIGVRDHSIFLDHIPKAFDFEVVSSVFYSNGYSPSIEYSTVLVDQIWTIK